jgi:hypothetical protein
MRYEKCYSSEEKVTKELDIIFEDLSSQECDLEVD